MLICWKKGVRPDPWQDDPIWFAHMCQLGGGSNINYVKWFSGRRHITHHMRPLCEMGCHPQTLRQRPAESNPDDSTEEDSAQRRLIPGTGMTIARQSFHSMSKRGNGQARPSSHDCLWKNKHENGKSPHHVLTKYILKWPMFSVWTAFLFQMKSVPLENCGFPLLYVFWRETCVAFRLPCA